MPDNFGTGATLVELTSGTAGAQGVTGTATKKLVGFSVRENAGTPAAATAILRHGTDNTGTPIAFISLAASGVQTIEFIAAGGIDIPNGVFVDRLSGTTHLTLWTKG